MPRNLRTNIELALNIVIAVAVVVIAGVVVKRYIFSQPTNFTLEQQKQLLMGTRMNVPNIDWEQNGKSLVFFLDKDCVHCTNSAAFYRQLIEEASKRDVRSLAILQNPIEEAKQYVQSLKLPIENVQTGSMSSYRIPGVPSVVLLDNKGIVRSVWLGAKPTREREMKDELIALFEAEISR